MNEKLRKAILELDHATIRKLSPLLPANENAYLRGVHKVRAVLEDATPEQRAESIAYLNAHFSTAAFGTPVHNTPITMGEIIRYHRSLSRQPDDMHEKAARFLENLGIEGN